MRGIINNIIIFYEIEAKALDVLVANTQKALNDLNREKKADEQAERVRNFAKNLTRDLDNMLTHFYFLKERKKRQHKEMTQSQVNALVDFANFVKSLTKRLRPVWEYFNKGPTFEEKVDRDIEELEAYTKAQLRKFDEALAEMPDTLTTQLSKYSHNLLGNIAGFFKYQGFDIKKLKRTQPKKQQKELRHNNKQGSSARIGRSPDEQVENLVCGLNVTSTKYKNSKSKYQTYSKIY